MDIGAMTEPIQQVQEQKSKRPSRWSLIGIKLSNKGKIRENSCTTNNQSEDALDDFYQHR
jgi:hypothetical protein